MQVVDTLQTVFESRGLTTLVGGFARLANAQDRLKVAQNSLNKAINTGKGIMQATVAAQTAMRGLGIAAVDMAQQAAQGIQKLIGLADKAVDAYTAFGRTVMDIRDLTGVSGAEAVGAASLFKAAGLSDMQQMREILRMNAAMFTGRGREALGRMGIGANPNQSGLSMLNQIAAAWQRMGPSMQRTRDLEDIFGARGAAQMLPLLRMSKDTREQIEGLANTFDTRGLDAIQHFQEKTAMLSETMMQRFVFPLASKALPVLEMVVDSVTKLIDLFGRLDRMLHGGLTWAVILGGVALALGQIGRGVGAAIIAFKALNSTLKITAVWEAITDALSGNWKNLAMGAAVAAGVGLSIYGLDKLLGDKGNEHKKATDDFGDHVDKFGKAVDSWVDQFDKSKGKGGIPKGLGVLDVGSLSRQLALGAIG